ncbi:hypothetical protein Tco_0281380 [Tanacetum coccineum]
MVAPTTPRPVSGEGWTMDQLPKEVIDRRAIPDAMAQRHYESDVYDAFSNNDFSIQDIRTLNERIIDLRLVPPGLFFGVGLATTWDFPGFFPVFKDTGGNGNAIPPNHPVGQNTTHLLSADQSIPDKTDSQLEVEVEDPKVVISREKKKAQAPKTAAKKKENRKRANNEGGIVSINSGNTDGGPNAPDDENRSVSHSPRGSVSESVHNFVNVEEIKDKESLPRIESFVNLSEKPVHPEKEQAFLSESNAYGSSHPLNYEDSNLLVGAPASQPRDILTGQNVEEGESSRSATIHVPDWSIPHSCRVDTPMWCQELMVHLAPPAAQDESNALTNEVDLHKAWLAGAHAECPDTVRKLVTARQDLEHNARLYTGAINHYKELKEKHDGYEQKVKLLEDERNNLSAVNRDQALKIQKLEAEVARKDFALAAAERVSTDRARILLPTMVGRLLQNHEYKKSLSEPFNMAIQAGWGKGLAEGRSEKEILAALHRAKTFDAYSDKKLYPMYHKLFEKEYPYIMKISSGYRHSVADHIKIHPNLAPSRGTPAPTISKALGGSSLPPNQKKT